MRTKLNLFLLSTFCLFSLSIRAQQTTVFTYQGRLTDTNIAANGTYNMQFRLYGSLAGADLIGSIPSTQVTVTGGIFTVPLDFGAAGFPSASLRWLEIQVANTTLTPRQQITSAPYAVQAANATNSSQLGGIAANQYVLTGDSRMSDNRLPLPGSFAYIQNEDAGTGVVSFNINGNGAVGGTLRLGSSATDPTGTNGLMYYNTASNKFRCFEGSAWKDCITVATSQAKPAETQQQEVEKLRQQVEQQQAVIDGLKKLLCSQNRRAEVCKQEE